jgi:hypothetical protein
VRRSPRRLRGRRLRHALIDRAKPAALSSVFTPMRIVLSLAALVALAPGCVPASTAAAQSTGSCAVDAECVLVDVCGCSCHAELGRTLPPVVCSVACDARPCDGHRAVCEAGACVMR